MGSGQIALGSYNYIANCKLFYMHMVYIYTIYIYKRMLYIYIHTYVSVQYMYMYRYIYICLCICIVYSNVFIYICIYICYRCVYVCIYLFICTHMYIKVFMHIYIYICIQMLPPKIYNFKLFVDVKEVVLLSKKISTYSGQKAQHFLKEAICFKLQRSFPCLKKGTLIHKLQFSFQAKQDFVQETVPLQNIEHSL